MTISVVRGRDADYTVRLRDGNDNPIDITGVTFATAKHKKDGGGSVDVSSPKDVGKDEVQTLTFAPTPTAGDFTLTIGDEVTTAIAYNASTTDIENAINALSKQDGVTVSGDFTTGLVVTFTGGSGKRNQPTISVTDNTLANGVNSSAASVVVNTEGSPESGIEFIDVKCGVLKVFLSEEDTSLMAKGKNQDIDIIVRVGAKDLNIPPLSKVLEVKAGAFEGT